MDVLKVGGTYRSVLVLVDTTADPTVSAWSDDDIFNPVVLVDGVEVDIVVTIARHDTVVGKYLITVPLITVPVGSHVEIFGTVEVNAVAYHWYTEVITVEDLSIAAINADATQTTARTNAATAATQAATAATQATTAATEIGKVHRSATAVAAGAAMRRTAVADSATTLDETVGPTP